MRIGDLSTLFEMRPETIRYYEKEGILSPARKADSTFREYSIWDYLDLCECRRYRQMDFGMNEVRSLMKSADLEQISSALGERQQALTEKARAQLALAEEVRSLKERIDNAKLNIGNFWYKTEPEKRGIFITERVGNRYSDINTADPVLRQWMHNNLFLGGYLLIRPDDILQGIDRNQWYFVTDADTFRRLGLPEEGSVLIPRQVSLHTIVDIGEKESLSLKKFEPILEELSQRNLKIDGPIVGELMIRCYEGKTYHRYMELMIRVVKT